MSEWQKIEFIGTGQNGGQLPGKIVPKKSYRKIDKIDDDGMDYDYMVTFRITEACNLKCDYCLWHSGRHYDYETIIASIDTLYEFFIKQGFKRVLFYYHGGEATRHPKCADILEYVKNKGIETGITVYNELQTNLSINGDKLDKILKHTDQINISFHYLELLVHNRLGTFNSNWDKLVDANMKIHNFDIMMEDVSVGVREFNGKQFEVSVDDFYKQITRFIGYDRILNSEMIYGFGYVDDSEHEKDIVKSHKEFYRKFNKTEQQYEIDGEIYTTNDLFRLGVDNRGWLCEAGQISVVVNGDGNVFHCGMHMTKYIKGYGNDVPYTNLVNDRVCMAKLAILYKTGTICRWDYCGGDYYIPRVPK